MTRALVIATLLVGCGTSMPSVDAGADAALATGDAEVDGGLGACDFLRCRPQCTAEGAPSCGDDPECAGCRPVCGSSDMGTIEGMCAGGRFVLHDGTTECESTGFCIRD